MHDGGKVIIGLIVFVGLITFPLWWGGFFGQPAEDEAGPQPVLSPTAQAATVCVREAAWMKSSHMDLINEWRDRVVRGGEYIYEGDEGREYVMSITNTCLGCHDNKEQFCDECHDYLGVKPYCWECHIATEGSLQ